MTGRKRYTGRRRIAPALLLGTILGGGAVPAPAQTPAPAQNPAPAQTRAPAPAQTPAPAAPASAIPTVTAPPAGASAIPNSLGTIKAIAVTGAQRLEPETVRSYVKLAAGAPYSRETIDQAIKDLYATELFADVQIRDDAGVLTLQIRENPVINRIVLEGNKRLKEDKIRPEIKLAPRQIFTRSKVRADVARIIELYRRQGRFAASVDPKMVTLDQNRVDIVFEISEGAKSKVRQINIIGNEKFSDGDLRSEMATQQARFYRFFSSATSYDPDRLAYDQQKLRQYYLTQGYADFRVISAVAELTPDKRDFIITYVVEEGERYKFGDVTLESDIRDVKAEDFKRFIPVEKGEWYNAKIIEDTIDTLSEATGLLGFTPDIRPDFVADKEARVMNVLFRINDAPRRYVESIDIVGNTVTRDKVIRREFRLAEGDAFNSFRVKRSRDRIQSLGYFQDKLEITEKPGSAPDRVVLEAAVEERSTGELQVSAGFSSLERFIVDLSIRQRNFMGKGQEVSASANYSAYSKSVEVGFTEPFLFDRNIAIGGSIYRRDFNSFRFLENNDRDTNYEQTTTGFQLRSGLALTEFTSLALRYSLNFDDVTLDESQFFFNGQCEPLLAGRYLCESTGKRTTSSLGYSLVYDNLNNRIRPSGGQRAIFSQDFAGLGGNVKYIRTTAQASKFWNLGSNFIFSLAAQGGYIHSLQGTRRDSAGNSIETIRIVDRFTLGEPQMRGFDIRGIGPRIQRFNVDQQGNPVGERISDDALGGRAYYMGRAEIEIPLGSGAREMGLRPSIYADVGAAFGLKRPVLTTFDRDANGNILPRFLPQLDDQGRPIFVTPGTPAMGDIPGVPGVVTPCPAGVEVNGVCSGATPNTAVGTPLSPFAEVYTGNSAKPRLAVGIGVNWNSPFGPLRIDFARALLKDKGDDPKLFTFNVGTQF